MGRNAGALAQTMPILTSGSRQATFATTSQVTSGDLTAAERAVRTVQHTAVLVVILG